MAFLHDRLPTSLKQHGWTHVIFSFIIRITQCPFLNDFASPTVLLPFPETISSIDCWQLLRLDQNITQFHKTILYNCFAAAFAYHKWDWPVISSSLSPNVFYNRTFRPVLAVLISMTQNNLYLLPSTGPYCLLYKSLNKVSQLHLGDMWHWLYSKCVTLKTGKSISIILCWGYK